MGQWEELLPTDGTHLEVLQATTMAADDDSLARLKATDDLRKAEIDKLEKENALRDAAISGGLGTVSTEIKVHVGTEEQDGQRS
jgi:hypothetical protein